RAAAALCASAPADRVVDAQTALADDLDPPPSPTMTGATRLHLARVLLGRAVAQALGPEADAHAD
ncbi:MAG: xanthine dehydrogenase family protein subunit M, partial [Beijerinckiaceae bacterium]|nr:xanthine dehydrogenase family protein subunit M [Beijerinckiaceae bacterium]